MKIAVFIALACLLAFAAGQYPQRSSSPEKVVRRRSNPSRPSQPITATPSLQPVYPGSGAEEGYSSPHGPARARLGRPVRPGRGRRPDQPRQADIVRERTDYIVEALQAQNYQTLGQLVDEDTVFEVHSLLPIKGHYKGQRGFLELLMKNQRVMQRDNVNIQILHLSEDRYTAILRSDFDGTFLNNGATFRNGRRCVVMRFDPVDLLLRHVSITDMDAERWIVAYQPLALRILHNTTVEMLRYQEGLENSLQQYFSPQALLRVNVYPDSVLSSTTFQGFEQIGKGYNELMTIASTSTCPFGVRSGELVRHLQSSRHEERPLSVSNANYNVNTSDAGSQISKEQLELMKAAMCIMRIEILTADDQSIVIMKTIGGVDQLWYERVLLDDQGLISSIDLTFAEPLKPWDIYRSVQTQPAHPAPSQPSQPSQPPVRPSEPSHPVEPPPHNTTQPSQPAQPAEPSTQPAVNASQPSTPTQPTPNTHWF